MDTSNSSSRKEKRELTATQQKVKTAINWVLNILCVVLVIFALVVAVLTIIRTTNEDKITKIGDKCYFSVMSDSMEPMFKKGDVIVAKSFSPSTDGDKLKVGMVVSFKTTWFSPTSGNGYASYNTHRIMKINKKDGVVVSVNTRGDKKGLASGVTWQEATDSKYEGEWDTTQVPISSIVATWGDVDGDMNFTEGNNLKGAGKLGVFMQDPEKGQTRFLCIVVLPLILLFVVYAFILVRTLIIAKLENAKKVIGEQAITVDSLSDEEKRRLAQEYLASLNAQGAEKSDDTSSDVKEPTSVENTDGSGAESVDTAESVDAGEGEVADADTTDVE